jgi:hypothetical protein
MLRKNLGIQHDCSLPMMRLALCGSSTAKGSTSFHSMHLFLADLLGTTWQKSAKPSTTKRLRGARHSQRCLMSCELHIPVTAHSLAPWGAQSYFIGFNGKTEKISMAIRLHSRTLTWYIERKRGECDYVSGSVTGSSTIYCTKTLVKTGFISSHRQYFSNVMLRSI